MSEPVSSKPFHELMVSLKETGFISHSDRLESVLNGVWTTSSELIFELGVVVVSIRKECRSLSPDQKVLLKQCLKEVRKVWPGFGLFSWFPIRW